MRNVDPMTGADPLFAAWFKHATKNKMATAERQRFETIEQGKKGKHFTDAQYFQMIRERGICPKCEEATYRCQGWAENQISQCPACGYRGKTVTLDEYITNQYYRS